MKIVNNRVVCSGCKEPFEVGQKMVAFLKAPALIATLLSGTVSGMPAITQQETTEKEEFFHEGCD